MARRRQGGIDVVASMPWWIGIALGVLGYIALRHGVGWYFAATGNPHLSGFGKAASTGAMAPLAWMLLAGCWIGALVAFAGRAQRRKLLDNQTGVDSLRQISWRQFEQLAGEAFRRQGYAVEETGLGGADGGIDLVLRKNGQLTLVQCKQWQNWQVGVKVVREMYGLQVHHGAAAVKIVACGEYTGEARRFAQGKAIELINGAQLIASVRAVQTSNAPRSRPLDSPLALLASMVASLLVIAALSPTTTTSTPSTPSAAVTRYVTPYVAPQRPLPPPSPHPTDATPRPSQQAVIYASEGQDAAELREWKKRNAESMKILQKTTKEMPLR